MLPNREHTNEQTRGGIHGCYPTAAERGRERECVCVDARGNARQGVGIQSVLGLRGSNGTVASL